MSSELLLLAYLGTICAIVGTFLFMRSRTAKVAAQPNAAAGADADRDEAPVRRGGRRAGGLDRMRAGRGRRRGGRPAGAGAGAGGAGVVDENAAMNADGVDEFDGDDRAARKAAEKEARRLAREERIREQKEKSEKRAEKDRARAEERERRQQEREEEEARLEEERKKAEQEEYDEWKDMFSVEDKGEVQRASAEEKAAMLEKFVQTLKDRKVVVLDEIAAEFDMKTPAVVKRIRALEEAGRLTGVIDDRGKFIYVSPDELTAIADWIKQRGRVTISDIIAQSNRIVTLTPQESAI